MSKIFSSPEPQTIDFQLEINFRHTLTPLFEALQF